MSYNEWDKLKKVIVGVADNAQVPDIDISLRCVNYAGSNSVSASISLLPIQLVLYKLLS